MELKEQPLIGTREVRHSLNRTFYGIESLKQRNDFVFVPVLIVPFMELKGLLSRSCSTGTLSS